MIRRVLLIVLLGILSAGPMAGASSIYDSTFDVCKKMGTLPVPILVQWTFRGLSPSPLFYRHVLKGLVWSSAWQGISEFNFAEWSDAYVAVVTHEQFQKALADCMPFEIEFHKNNQKFDIYPKNQTLRDLIMDLVKNYDSRGKTLAGIGIGGSLLAGGGAMSLAARFLPKTVVAANVALTGAGAYALYEQIRHNHDVATELDKACGEGEKDEACLANTLASISQSLGNPTEFGAAMRQVILEDIEALKKQIVKTKEGSPEFIALEVKIAKLERSLIKIAELDQLAKEAGL